MRTVVNINAGGRTRRSGVVHGLVLVAILLALAAALATPTTAQNRDARTPKPYSDSAPTNPDTEFKRFHPYALKLIVRGQREEAIAFLHNAPEIVRQHRDTDLLVELAEGRSSWQLDASSWPRERTLPTTPPSPPGVGVWESDPSIVLPGAAKFSLWTLWQMPLPGREKYAP